MIGEYNSILVLLSYGIAFLGSYIAIAGCEQLRLLYVRQKDASFRQLMLWYVLIGLSLGGVGIWCMHFIGMSAMTLRDGAGKEVAISYNVGVSVMSLLVAVVAVIGGVMVASNDRVFAKTKTEILEMLVNDFHVLSLEDIRKMTQWQFLCLVVITDVKYLCGGGLLASGGVVVMHYLGMSAMEFEGEIAWNGGVVAGSIVIAMFAAVAAFWILFRLLSIYPRWESLRLVSAMIMGVAVCGMHYCGMMAADFGLTVGRKNELSWKTSSLSSGETLNPVLFGAMLVLWLLTMKILADLRGTVDEYRQRLKKCSVKSRSGDNGSHASTASPSRFVSLLRNGSSVLPAPAIENNDSDSCSKSSSEVRSPATDMIATDNHSNGLLTFTPHLSTVACPQLHQGVSSTHRDTVTEV